MNPFMVTLWYLGMLYLTLDKMPLEKTSWGLRSVSESLLWVAASLLLFLQVAYTEEYEQQRGKGSFPAHLTPGYKMSKKASEQASDVSSEMYTYMHAPPPPLRSSVGNELHVPPD